MMREKTYDYPFTAIVGQEPMKEAILINLVNPSAGGVLIRGQKGTAKTTAVRAIPGLMNEIIRESEEKQYGYELAIKNHIGGIFLWLLRYWHANGEEPLLEDFENQQLKQQLSPALTYMITNYEKSISAADMAKLCNLSYSYFSRSFNRLLHMNFSDYLNEIRIREAEKLLVSTTQNVTEIASAVGFCTTSYFIKQFTKYLHISPKQYQKQMRQGQKDFIA